MLCNAVVNIDWGARAEFMGVVFRRRDSYVEISGMEEAMM